MLAAMREGFTSVIMDASRYPYEKNVRMTCEIVRSARELGVDVEAEIGFVGSGANVSDYTDESKYTAAEEAARFARETGVDALAVAIGNGHGHYAVMPHLAIDRLRRIDEAVSVPLVLHGGSGIPDDQLIQAVQSGMIKFNFGTNYGQAISQAMASYAKENEHPSAMGMVGAGKEAGKAFVLGRMRVLNPRGITLF
jgi:ketose-bisphosphate aldolase